MISIKDFVVVAFSVCLKIKMRSFDGFYERYLGYMFKLWLFRFDYSSLKISNWVSINE